MFPEKLLLVFYSYCSLGFFYNRTGWQHYKKQLFSMVYQWHQGKKSHSYLQLRKENHFSLVNSHARNSGRVETSQSLWALPIIFCMSLSAISNWKENELNRIWKFLPHRDVLFFFFVVIFLDLIEKRDVLHHLH